MARNMRKFEQRLMAESDTILQLVLALATGKDPLGVLDDLDQPISRPFLMAWFRALTDMAKNASYRVPVKERYQTKDAKILVDRIMEDVMTGVIDVKDGKDMLDFMASKINTIELANLKERMDAAAENLTNALNITVVPSGAAKDRTLN